VLAAALGRAAVGQRRRAQRRRAVVPRAAIRAAETILVLWRLAPRAAAARPTIQRPTRGSRVANIKSQLKRIKTNEKARLRNKSVKSSLKTAVRRFREAADAGERDEAAVAMRRASRQLDKAVSKGVIHANQAANKKSAMAQRANSL
jgi:small subunit ribosomal protein S20